MTVKETIMQYQQLDSAKNSLQTARDKVSRGKEELEFQERELRRDECIWKQRKRRLEIDLNENQSRLKKKKKRLENQKALVEDDQKKLENEQPKIKEVEACFEVIRVDRSIYGGLGVEEDNDDKMPTLARTVSYEDSDESPMPPRISSDSGTEADLPSSNNNAESVDSSSDANSDANTTNHTSHLKQPSHSTQSFSGISTQDQATLKIIKTILHKMLLTYKKKFFKQHGRKASSSADFMPVAIVFTMNDKIRKMIGKNSNNDSDASSRTLMITSGSGTDDGSSNTQSVDSFNNANGDSKTTTHTSHLTQPFSIASAQVLAILKAVKSSLYKMLRSYEKNFFKQHGRNVSSFSDVKPMANEYRMHKEIRNMIASIKENSNKGSGTSPRTPMITCGSGVDDGDCNAGSVESFISANGDSKTTTHNLHSAQLSHSAQSFSSDSTQYIATLKAEIATLCQTVEAYKKDFFKRHKRQVLTVADIKPVASEYKRWKEIRKEIVSIQENSNKDSDASSRTPMITCGSGTDGRTNCNSYAENVGASNSFISNASPVLCNGDGSRNEFLFQEIVVEECGESGANGSYEPYDTDLCGCQYIYSKRGEYCGKKATFFLYHQSSDDFGRWRWVLTVSAPSFFEDLFFSKKHKRFENKLPKVRDWNKRSGVGVGSYPRLTGRKKCQSNTV